MENAELKTMKNVIYIVTILTIVAWLVGFFILGAGDMIHILLVMAITLVLFKIFQEEHIFK